MLRMVKLSSAQMESYYVQKDGSAKQDYFCNGQEEQGRWFGKGAEKLHLIGLVSREDFHALSENINPVTGDRLTLRTKANRIPAYDIVTDLGNKDLSILCEVYGDRRIEFAHKRANEKMLQEIQEWAIAKVRKDGVIGERETGNICVASFLHRTARPLDDGTPDPHVHTHNVLLSATFDDVEQVWKALDTIEIRKRLPQFQASYHAHLADEVQALGYDIEQRGIAFGIKGFPEELRAKHSRRDAVIRAERDRRGRMTDKEADKLAALTRNTKQSARLTISELRGEWRGKSTEAEERFCLETIAASKARCLRREQGIERPARPPGDDGVERRAIDMALLDKLSRKSVVSEFDLFHGALEYGIVDRLDRKRLMRLIEEDPCFIRREQDGQVLLTTPQVLAEERDVLAFARNGRGTLLPMAADHRIDDERLDGQQRAAVHHVLNSTDRVTVIVGRAGVGKTTLMREARRAIESQGHTLRTFAPTGKASREVLRNEGFEDATTVSALLYNKTLQEQCRDGVWWIDEAGLMSTPMGHAVFDLAEKLNARIVLSGDPNQHAPVERGEFLQLLLDHDAVEAATVSDVKRQTGIYKQACELLSAGRVEEGFAKLDEMGAIVEVEDDSRFEKLADEYAKRLSLGKTAMVIAPTHREGERVTTAIRERLVRDNALGQERDFVRLKRVDLTDGKQRTAEFYEPGMVLQAMKPSRGVRTGDRLDVMRVMPGGLVVRDATGNDRLLIVDDVGDRFCAFRKESIAISTGETIRITNGGRHNGHRLETDAIYQVRGFDPEGNVTLTNGMTLKPDFGHWSYGYVTTSMSGQGRTVDFVFISESAESLVAADRRQFYTSITRGKLGAAVFTDDRELLLEAVREKRERMSAMDLVNPLPFPTEKPERPLMKQLGKLELEDDLDRMPLEAIDVRHEAVLFR